MIRRLRLHTPVLVLPAAAVLVIAVVLLVTGVPRAVDSARIYGGPTEGARLLSWRAELFEGDRNRQTPSRRTPFRVQVSDGEGHHAEWRGATNGDGIAEVLFDIPGGNIRGALDVRVLAGDRAVTLADGGVSLSSERWLQGARRRGGWIEGLAKGLLRLRVAPVRGVFAVPFTEDLWVLVADPGGAVRGADIDVQAQGAHVSYPFGRMTDASGRLRIRLMPMDHSASAVVGARTRERSGEMPFELPVLPGAMRATLDGNRVIVESPIERDVAYVSLTDGRYRLRGAVVDLKRDGRGGARGSFAVDAAVLNPPLWAVVSSEVDTRSMARVGWPLLPDADTSADPLRTLDVPDRLLLDGTRAAFEREDLRRQRIRAVAGLFAVGAMIVALRLLLHRARATRAELETHFLEQGYDAETARQLSQSREGGTRAVFIALLCIALGFAALSLFALLRK